jgi:hypothetical protein
MADSQVGYTPGTGTNVKVRSTGTGLQEVVAIGVPDADSVVPGDATYGLGVDEKRSAEQTGAPGDGRKTVTTAGTRVALAASTACKWVIVQALPANTDWVFVGAAATVVAAGGSERGTGLLAGDSATIPVTNLSLVGLDSRVNGEGVTFTYGA